MRRYILVGVILFLGFAVANAPAGMLARALAPVTQINLGQTQGTIWSGNGQLAIDGQDMGRLSWRFNPKALLQLAVGYHLTVSGEGLALSGSGAYGLGRVVTGDIAGKLDARAVNPWIAKYDLQLTGDLDIDHLAFELVEPESLGAPGYEVANQFTKAQGLLRWSGGPVSYTLSERSSTQRLPPMVANLSTAQNGPQVQIMADPGNIPLMEMGLQNEGFVRIGITKRFTQILQTPWPGNEPEDAVVLQVEQQVF